MGNVREGYKVTELGEIPVEWDLVTLDTISSLITKGTSPSTYGFDFLDEGVNFIKIESISRKNQIISKNISKVSEECHSKLNRSQIENKDLLISIAGTLGRFGIVSEEYLPANTNQALAIVRLKDKDLVNYVYYALQASHIEEEIRSIATTGAQPNLSLKQIGNMKIMFPNQSEQEKIVEIFSVLDEQLENIEQLIEKTIELKKGLMQQLLTKGIGHTEFKQSELGEIPINWEITTLGNSCMIIMGQSPKGTSYNSEGIGVPLLNGPTEFGVRYPRTIQWTNEPTKFCAFGDILFCVRGSSIGRMNIANDEYCIGRGLAAIRQSEYTITSFMEYVLHYQVEKVLKNTAGSTFPNITKDELANFNFAIPNIEEQQKIAEILSTVDAEIDSYGQEKSKYEALKKGLMQQLLTGQLRVKV